MAATIRPLGPVANVLNTATNSYGNATMVLIANPTAAAINVARYDSGGTLIGAVPVMANTYIILEKEQTDVINASANTLFGAKVGATN
jgi:hypothetical protein